MSKPFLLARLFATAALAMAASAGCAKPTATVEKLIVSDPRVAALDAQLNAAYKEALKSTPAATLRAEQRKWLAEVRDKCPDAACLVAQYTARNAQLAATPARASACPVKEDDLLSHWQRVKGGEFEEFALTREGSVRSFASWLHHRPEMMGSWSLDKCTLNIDNPDNPKLSFTYKITGFAGKILQLQDADSGDSMRYKQSAGK